MKHRLLLRNIMLYLKSKKKLENQRLETKAAFDMKNAQYAELLSLVQEEEGVTTSSEVVE